jgi:hypothetical protein
MAGAVGKLPAIAVKVEGCEGKYKTFEWSPIRAVPYVAGAERLLFVDFLHEIHIVPPEIGQFADAINLRLIGVFALAKHGSRAHFGAVRPRKQSAARRKMAARSCQGMASQAGLAARAASMAAVTCPALPFEYCPST